jgi:fatty acid-binding protein DegV
MAIVDIQSHLAARNPGHRGEQIAKALESLDESITMLSMVKDSVTLHDEGSTTHEAFQIVYNRLKREAGALMELL